MLYALLIGIVIGASITLLYFQLRYPTVGKWSINQFNPEKDIFQICFTRNPEIIYHRKWIVFTVEKDREKS